LLAHGEPRGRGQRDALGVDLEMTAEAFSRVAPPKAVSAQGEKSARNPRGNLRRHGAHEVGGGDERPIVARQGLLDVRGVWRFVRVEQISMGRHLPKKCSRM